MANFLLKMLRSVKYKNNLDIFKLRGRNLKFFRTYPVSYFWLLFGFIFQYFSVFFFLVEIRL